MPHTRADVIRTHNELLRLLGEQRDIFAGAIANLDNTKRMLLMVNDGIMQDRMDNGEPLELTEPVRRTIKDLADKIAGNGP